MYTRTHFPTRSLQSSGNCRVRLTPEQNGTCFLHLWWMLILQPRHLRPCLCTSFRSPPQYPHGTGSLYWICTQSCSWPATNEGGRPFHPRPSCESTPFEGSVSDRVAETFTLSYRDSCTDRQTDRQQYTPHTPSTPKARPHYGATGGDTVWPAAQTVYCVHEGNL